MSERRFPVLLDYRTRAEAERLGCPTSVPWSLVEPHHEQAMRTHSQTLERLAERGGLDPRELVAVLNGEGLRAVMERSLEDAVGLLRHAVERDDEHREAVCRERDAMRSAIEAHLSAMGACEESEEQCTKCHVDDCTYCGLSDAIGQGGCTEDCVHREETP